MDFFKSVFSEDPDPDPSPSPNPQKDHNSPSQSPKSQDPPSPNPNSEPESSSSPGAWNFGGLIKTLASKSETVMQVYRRDLEEFRTGLKKETEIIREAATHALKELPASIEVAQQSIGSVGHVIDEFGNSVWRGTSEILSSKESILDLEADSSDNQFLGNSKRYSRFEAQVSAIQSDVTTFCEEPEDLSDFGKWKLGFVLEEKREEIDESLVGGNGVMEEIYRKFVPGVVDRETFWERYFYRVYKLKQVDDARADLVKRAISGDEEELSWDVDDDDEDEEKNGPEAKSNSSGSNEEKKEIVESVLEKKSVDEPEVRGSEVLDGEADVKAPVGQPLSGNVTNENVKPVSDNVYDENVKPVSDNVYDESVKPISDNVSDENVKLVSDNVSDETVQSGEKASSSESKSEEVVNNSDEKSLPEEKNDTNGSSKGSDLPVAAIQPSVPEEEEDIGWDEIEDANNNVDKKASVTGSPNSSAVPKRSITADEEEDLSWDIEDDDEPVKH